MHTHIAEFRGSATVLFASVTLYCTYLNLFVFVYVCVSLSDGYGQMGFWICIVLGGRAESVGKWICEVVTPTANITKYVQMYAKHFVV